MSLNPAKRFGRWWLSRRAELRLALRVTVAGVLTYAVATALDLPQGYWAVFTAVIVMQASVGGSVKAGLDWLIGTLGGAVFGVVVATLVPHGDPIALGIAIAVAIAPCALMAALHPSFRVAPLTAVIVVLAINPQASPIVSAIDRVLEIGVGSIIGIIVSLTVLPARAHGMAAGAAARVLDLFADLLIFLLESVTTHTGTDGNETRHHDIRVALARVEALADEAVRERTSRLSTDTDPGPLARTLRRLRGDLVMINRAAVTPMPPAIGAAMEAAITHVARAASAYLRDTGAALKARQPPPVLDGVDAALHEYGAALATLRRDGVTRDMTDDAAGRIFALAFALEQLRQNFHDLGARTAEWAKAVD